MCQSSFRTSHDQSREMATYFKKQSLPTSNEAGLPDAVTLEANKAVENILEEERSCGASGRKRKNRSWNFAWWVCGGRNL